VVTEHEFPNKDGLANEADEFTLTDPNISTSFPMTVAEANDVNKATFRSDPTESLQAIFNFEPVDTSSIRTDADVTLNPLPAKQSEVADTDSPVRRLNEVDTELSKMPSPPTIKDLFINAWSSTDS
jgi:hypothetical protein